MMAGVIGIHVETVRLLCKRYGIQARAFSAAHTLRYDRNPLRHVMPSQVERETMNGLMLSDGTLEMSPSGLAARYGHVSKYTMTLEKVASTLPSLRFGKIYRYRHLCPHKPCGKRHVIFMFKSHALSWLGEERRRWYPNGEKRVPRDLVLTPEVCYWWFVGDGSICVRRYDLKLSTEGFTDECRSRLATALLRVGIKSRAVARGCMYVPAEDVPKFYAFIGPCKNQEYAYKWAYTPPQWAFRRDGMRGQRIGESRRGKERRERRERKVM